LSSVAANMAGEIARTINPAASGSAHFPFMAVPPV
jgi:hypothetical protein